MQEISCIAFSYLLSWIYSNIHVFTGTLDKHEVNFKVSGTCANVDKKSWQGLSIHKIRETHKTM